MKKLYFTTPMTSFVQEWDGVSPEPANIASFEFEGTPSSSDKRYILTPTQNYVTIYPEIADEDLEAFLASQSLLTSPATVSPVKFKLGFTAEERVAIYASTNPYVVDFLRILDDPRLFSIDLRSANTVAALNLLVSLGLITEARKLELLTNF